MTKGVLELDGIQTTFELSKTVRPKELEQFDAKAIQYLLEKYKVWKELKEKEKVKANEL